MTTFFLVRHAAHQQQDKVLVGRMAGVRLGEAGRRQARRLAARLTGEGLTAVQSSPRERARETGEPIAARAGVALEIAAALDEIDVGDWTGRTFAALDADSRWSRWNEARATARPPRGESMQALQDRLWTHLERLHGADADGRIVLVTHAEAIRAVLLRCLGIALDDFAGIAIDPASISTVALDERGARVLTVNEAVGP
jgi:probable phosphoglycerate mutase